MSEVEKKKLEARIETLVRRLNTEPLVQGVWYRRNTSAYQLLTYLNHLAALFMARQPETMAIFVRRAWRYLEQAPENAVTPDYRQEAEEYLRVVSDWVRTFDGVPDHQLKLLSGGSLVSTSTEE